MILTIITQESNTKCYNIARTNQHCASKNPRSSKALTLKCYGSRRRDFIFIFLDFELYTQKSKQIPFLESTGNLLSFETKFEKMYKNRFKS